MAASRGGSEQPERRLLRGAPPQGRGGGRGRGGVLLLPQRRRRRRGMGRAVGEKIDTWGQGYRRWAKESLFRLISHCNQTRLT
jgi:hypothetical protein